MPTYEYRCQACGHEFEMTVPLSAIGARQECPRCSSRDTRKKIPAYGTSVGSKTKPASAPRPERFT